MNQSSIHRWSYKNQGRENDRIRHRGGELYIGGAPVERIHG